MRGCMLGCLAAIPARFIILVLVIFTDYIGRGFQGSFWWPFLGWFFAPLTTLTYAWAMNTSGNRLEGGYLVAVIVAAIVDLYVAMDGGVWAYRANRRSREMGVWRISRRGGTIDDDGRENVRVRKP